MLFLTEKKKENISEIPSLAFLADPRKKLAKVKRGFGKLRMETLSVCPLRRLNREGFSFFACIENEPLFFGKESFPGGCLDKPQK